MSYLTGKRITALDAETTYTVLPNGSKSPSYNLPTNRMVSLGYKRVSNLSYDMMYWYFDKSNEKTAREDIQFMLDNTDVLVAHNAKFDLGWLKACGYKYEGKIFCTMLFEYLRNLGVKVPLSIDALLTKYNPSRMSVKHDTLDYYINKGVAVEDIPKDELISYGKNDVDILIKLFNSQQKEAFAHSASPLIEACNDFIHVLIDLELNGVKINTKLLDEIEIDYENEQAELDEQLHKIARDVMGNIDITLTNNRMLSNILYGRAPTDYKEWKRVFNIGTDNKGKKLYRPRYTKQAFMRIIGEQTKPLYKVTVHRCTHCEGAGKIHKNKKDGTPFKKATRCMHCDGSGAIYTNTKERAGLSGRPSSVRDVSANGFSVDKDKLQELATTTSGVTKQFCEMLVRRRAIETYKGTFIAGIKRNIANHNRNGILFPTLNQCITATGRLSSSDPNEQNMPRANTFPVRRAFESRFSGGKIVKADYSQLEYRVAVELADDAYGRKNIADKVDVHAVTAEVMGCSRQDAKPDTFKPLYGGTKGTPTQEKYYEFFMETHKGIAKYQKSLQEQAISSGHISIPTGRVYNFPNTKRTSSGGATGATKIKNYVVQGFATADIVPLGGILLREALKGMESKIVLQIHDEWVVDAHPDEVDRVIVAINDSLLGVKEELKRRFNYSMTVPLDVEVSVGDNWMETKEVDANAYR